MEGLAPPLKLVLELRSSLEGGDSLRTALLSYCERNQDTFTEEIKKWYLDQQQNRRSSSTLQWQRFPYRKAILICLEAGLAGQAILPRLCELEEEIKLACRLQIEEHSAKLPVQVFLMVGLFMFPALLLLVLGPLVLHLVQEINR